MLTMVAGTSGVLAPDPAAHSAQWWAEHAGRQEMPRPVRAAIAAGIAPAARRGSAVPRQIRYRRTGGHRL